MNYFIPRNNKFFAFFITRHRLFWYVCTIGAVSLLWFGWWLLLYQPLQVRIVSAQNKCSQLSQQQIELTRRAREVNELEQIVSNLRHSFNQCTSMPNGYKCLLNLLLIKAVEADLKLLSCMPQPPVSHNWYVTHPVELSFVGQFPEMIEYMQLVGATDHLLYPRTVSIKRHVQQKSTLEDPLELAIKFDLIEVSRAIATENLREK